MATSEIVINEYLAIELRTKHANWQANGAIVSENTEAFAAKAKRPDIVVRDNPMSPVGVETEFSPGHSVEDDARLRLGKVYVPTGGTIYSVIAVKFPETYRKLPSSSIAKAITNERHLSFCLFSGESSTELAPFV